MPTPNCQANPTDITQSSSVTADREWLTVIQLPPYAPHLNPVESLWSVLRRTSQANWAFADPNDLITAIRRGLHQLQYRHDVFDGCLTGTGLRKPP